MYSISALVDERFESPTERAACVSSTGYVFARATKLESFKIVAFSQILKRENFPGSLFTP